MSIPTGMFVKCHNLTKVEMSNNIKKIGSCAFSFCSNMEKDQYPLRVRRGGKTGIYLLRGSRRTESSGYRNQDWCGCF